MIRYKAKKWWALKEADDGQYVAYHEYEDIANKWRKENDNLWDRIRQQREEIVVLEERVKRQKGAFEQYSSAVSKRMIKMAAAQGQEEYHRGVLEYKVSRYKAIALTFGVVIIILLVHAYI